MKKIKKTCFLIIITIVIIAIAVFFYVRNTSEKEQNNLLEIQIDRPDIMRDIVEKIGNISPVKPVLGGSWFVTRFWFVKDSNENFYVEYEDGHILRRVLLKAEKKDDEIKYKIIGYFEPGETNWILKQGKDPFFGENLDLYEYDEESRKWVKKN